MVRARRFGAMKPPTRMEPRRFPPPWSIEETDACFVVKDHTGTRWLTSISRGARAASGGKAAALDEARRIAANIAKLPGLLRH